MYELSSRYSYRSLFDEFGSIIRMQSSHADREALKAIKAIVESQTSERARQRVWLHFELKIAMRLKEAVADMHDFYNAYIRDPDEFAPCSLKSVEQQYRRMVQQARDEVARVKPPQRNIVAELEQVGA
jgi:hypothetical protein